jgi:glyoxylase I family protein
MVQLTGRFGKKSLGTLPPDRRSTQKAPFRAAPCEDITMMNAPAERSIARTAIARGAATFHGVRYLVADVKRAIDFYTTHLGFDIEHQHLPEFATVALGPLQIHLSGPGASGSRRLPGGEQQNPGGSTRVVLRVKDLPAVIEALRGAGAKFRNDMETGPAGRQIQVLDPDGNPVELFEPAH